MGRHLASPLLLAAVTAFLLACGGASSGPTAENLRSRAEDVAQANLNGEWQLAYEYQHPDFKLGCSQEEFDMGMSSDLLFVGGFMGMGADANPKRVYRALLGVDEGATLDIQVSVEEISGNQGTALTQVFHDGRRLDYGDEGAQGMKDWVFLEGRWYMDWDEAQQCGFLG